MGHCNETAAGIIEFHLNIQLCPEFLCWRPLQLCLVYERTHRSVRVRAGGSPSQWFTERLHLWEIGAYKVSQHRVLVLKGWQNNIWTNNYINTLTLTSKTIRKCPLKWKENDVKLQVTHLNVLYFIRSRADRVEVRDYNTEALCQAS